MVNQYFPEVTKEASTGQDATAVGTPTAARSVIYATTDGTKKVTLTVDQYANAGDAALGYEIAFEKSKRVPGFNPISVPNIGQQTSDGTVTQGAETHVGLGTLDGALIVGATLAGYGATPDNVAKLVALTRAEDAAAKAALGASARR